MLRASAFSTFKQTSGLLKEKSSVSKGTELFLVGNDAADLDSLERDLFVRIEVDRVWESHREAVDDPLSRLVHFDLAF